MPDNFVTISMQKSVEIPKLPNFIKVYNADYISIAELTDAQLEAVGKRWTEKLIELAKKKRNKP